MAKKENRKLSKLWQTMLLLLLCIPIHFLGQTFTAALNRKTVPVGDVFQISFTINTNASNFKAPDFRDFDVYSGPNQSSQMSVINGQMSQSISLSYYLAAKKEGKFTIGSASITAGGKTLQSNPVTIEVTKGNQSTQSQTQNNTQNDPGLKNEYSSSGGGDDIFIRTFVTKQKCFLGEQLVLTQKVYSRHQLKGFNNFKASSTNGFWSKEEDRNKQITLNSENLDGINYYVAEFSKTFLFPQRAGTLEIGPVELEAIVVIQSKKKPKNFWDQFFGGGGYEDQVHKLKGKSVKITVNPLPEKDKPADFSGAVGNFTFKAELDRDHVKENEAINLKISVNGKGNINLIDKPKINFPEEFETYDPKVNENITIGNTINGSKTYEYLLIPRKKGKYNINNYSFSYFDPEKKMYVTIAAPELQIQVDAGAAGSAGSASVFVPTNEIAESENDIRFIKKGDLMLREADTEFFNSAAHYAILGGIVLLFGGGMLLRYKIISDNKDQVAVKERKAARMARKKLTHAERFMKEQNKEKFYEEIMVALNSYLSNKLNIPPSDLNRESIKSKLTERNSSAATIENVLKTIDNCEYARFAPGAVSDNLNEMYQSTIELIAIIEEGKEKKA